MARKRKPTPETEAGKAFAREMTRENRPDAARKAAATRRTNKEAARVERDRTHFRVESNREFVTCYALYPPRNATLDEVIADLVEHFHGSGVEGDGFDSLDMAVWLDARIVAVVRKGPDGEPVVTRFDS